MTDYTTQDKDMRKRGYLPLAVCAEAIGCTLSTIYRWVRRGPNKPRGCLGVKLGRTTYVELGSLYARVGDDACAILKLREKLEG